MKGFITAKTAPDSERISEIRTINRFIILRHVVKVVVAREEEGRRIFMIEKALFRMGLQ